MKRGRLAEIFNRAVEGDQTAIVDLIDLFEPLIQKHARPFGRDAEDAAQTFRAAIIEALRNMDNPETTEQS